MSGLFATLLAHNKCDALTELVDIGAGVLKKRLKPNTSYVRNGYEYATDAFGRIKKAAGELRLDKAARDAHMQRTVGLKDGRQVGDAGGHLIGSQFGGHGGNANMVAMLDDGVNAYPNGTWGSMEKAWADALNEGKKVHVEIEPIYKDATARPHSFQVFETIDGVSKRRIVNNFDLLMTDDIQDLLQHIGELAFHSVPSGEWNSITLTVRAITSYLEQDASYVHHEKQFVPITFFVNDRHLDYDEQTAHSFEKLREAMYAEAPFRGAWYTAVMTITDQGKFDTDFGYEEKPEFDHKPVEEAYVLDFKQFPRNEEGTPEWLKEIVQKHGLKYHKPEPLA